MCACTHTKKQAVCILHELLSRRILFHLLSDKSRTLETQYQIFFVCSFLLSKLPFCESTCDGLCYNRQKNGFCLLTSFVLYWMVLWQRRKILLLLCSVVIKKDYLRNAVHKTAEERLYALCIIRYRKDRLNALPLHLESKCKCRQFKINF